MRGLDAAISAWPRAMVTALSAADALATYLVLGSETADRRGYLGNGD